MGREDLLSSLGGFPGEGVTTWTMLSPHSWTGWGGQGGGGGKRLVVDTGGFLHREEASGRGFEGLRCHAHNTPCKPHIAPWPFSQIPVCPSK